MTATIIRPAAFQRPQRKPVCPLSEALASLRLAELKSEATAQYAERVAATVARALEEQ